MHISCWSCFVARINRSQFPCCAILLIYIWLMFKNLFFRWIKCHNFRQRVDVSSSVSFRWSVDTHAPNYVKMNQYFTNEINVLSLFSVGHFEDRETKMSRNLLAPCSVYHRCPKLCYEDCHPCLTEFRRSLYRNKNTIRNKNCSSTLQRFKKVGEQFSVIDFRCISDS